MASPNKKNNSSKSSPTTPATPATKEPSNANIAGDQTPREAEVVFPTTVPEASDAENDPYSHVKAEPNQDGPQTTMTATSARAGDPQPQTPTQATTATPAHRTTPNPNEVGANDEEESEFDDEEHSEADQDEKWQWNDHEPTAASGEEEEAGDSIPSHLEAAISMSRDEQGSLVDDMRAYVIDGPTNIDGVLIEDSVVDVDGVSEGVGGDHEDHGVEENGGAAMATSARRNESPLGVASRPDTSALTPDGNGGQGEGCAGDPGLEVSGARMDAGLRDTTGEGGVQDPAVTGLEKRAER